MKKVRRFLPLSLMIFTLTLFVASSVFAATGAGWHENLSSRQGRAQMTKIPTYVQPGKTMWLGIDQYGKNASGNYDASLSPTIKYYIHNEAKDISTDYTFTVTGKKGGATNVKAYQSDKFALTGGNYVIYAENLSNFPVATGGNTYYAE